MKTTISRKLYCPSNKKYISKINATSIVYSDAEMAKTFNLLQCYFWIFYYAGYVVLEKKNFVEMNGEFDAKFKSEVK
jgi:hypothetical protein